MRCGRGPNAHGEGWRGFTPHVSPNRHRYRRRRTVDGRTTRHAGYAVSQRKRKLVEEGFGWQKSVGLLRKLRAAGALGDAAPEIACTGI